MLTKGGLSSPTGDYKKKPANHSKQRFSKRLYDNKEWINYAVVEQIKWIWGDVLNNILKKKIMQIVAL